MTPFQRLLDAAPTAGVGLILIMLIVTGFWAHARWEDGKLPPWLRALWGVLVDIVNVVVFGAVWALIIMVGVATLLTAVAILAAACYAVGYLALALLHFAGTRL